MNITDINLDTSEGMLLLMAVSRLATKLDLEYTPDQILELLEEMSNYTLEGVE